MQTYLQLSGMEKRKHSELNKFKIETLNIQDVHGAVKEEQELNFSF